ncbi:MAG TPA: class I SAM-dependent methyltransferase, partial [Candidatus Dormibacteraeota bacterium]|nr:class I SAM-dependent methyltransferase [Candidatus Dormibacteraeota bacterium]
MSVQVVAPPNLDPLKEQVRVHYDGIGPHRDAWYRRNSYYHSEVERRLGALIPPGSSVLELGCGTGNLLAALKPKRGYGIDLSSAMIDVARKNQPGFEFAVGDAESFKTDEPFDFVVASDLIGELGDINAMFDCVRDASGGRSRLILTFHSPTLEGVLRVAQRAGLAMAPYRQNWVGVDTVRNLLALSDMRVTFEEHSLLVPVAIPVLATAANRALA